MPKPALGLTIGKFYPYHLGHQHLINVAKTGCDHLVVVVAGRQGESIDGEERAAWIAADHPDVEVIYTTAELAEEPEPWAEHCLELLGGRRPDVVFTSESYGEPWAQAMGAAHVSVDEARERFPISGTKLRSEPERYWEWLTPVARAALIPRVVICGAESTGTTTLAEDLAEALGTAWVPEYGRFYWEGRRYRPEAESWEESEFEAIARGQVQLEESLAPLGRRVLICDTDPLVTGVFARRYLGRRSAVVEEMGRQRVPDAYIITGDEIPWHQDGTRESEAERSRMQAWFREAVAASGAPYLEVHGSREERRRQALEFIEAHTRLPSLVTLSPIEAHEGVIKERVEIETAGPVSGWLDGDGNRGDSVAA